MLEDMKEKHTKALVLVISLALLLFPLVAGCNIKQAARTAGEIMKNTYYDTETIQMVNVGDIDVAYKQFGKDDSPPLVMVPGFCMTMDTWDPRFLEALASEYKVIVADNRGMGKTTAGDKEFTMDQFADDTAGLIEKLGLKKANILGWSIGGDIVLDVMVRQPDKVIKVVSYAGDCGGPQKIGAPDYKETLMKLQDVDVPAKRVLAAIFPGWYMKANPSYWKQFPWPREMSKAENIKKQNQAYETWAGIYDKLTQTSLPVLVATGTLDVSTPPENAAILMKQIPNAKFAEFKGAGHGINYMYPYDFAYQIIQFLQK